MNIQVDPTSSNLASAMLKIRPRAVVGYGVKIFHPRSRNYVTRSPGKEYNTAEVESHSRVAKLDSRLDPPKISRIESSLFDSQVGSFEFRGNREQSPVTKLQSIIT